MKIADGVQSETIEIYRSGAGLRMLCARCDRTFPLGSRLTIRQILDLAASHQKTCGSQA